MFLIPLLHVNWLFQHHNPACGVLARKECGLLKSETTASYKARRVYLHHASFNLFSIYGNDLYFSPLVDYLVCLFPITAQVLLGNVPDYYVINWLPVYNYTIGILTIFVAATLIWVNSKPAIHIAVGTISIHALVILILQTSYRDVVAPDSIWAMVIRLTTWVIILGLMFAQTRRNKAAQLSNMPASGSRS